MSLSYQKAKLILYTEFIFLTCDFLVKVTIVFCVCEMISNLGNTDEWRTISVEYTILNRTFGEYE